jgi:hypothetical protein
MLARTKRCLDTLTRDRTPQETSRAPRQNYFLLRLFKRSPALARLPRKAPHVPPVRTATQTMMRPPRRKESLRGGGGGLRAKLRPPLPHFLYRRIQPATWSTSRMLTPCFGGRLRRCPRVTSSMRSSGAALDAAFLARADAIGADPEILTRLRSTGRRCRSTIRRRCPRAEGALRCTASSPSEAANGRQSDPSSERKLC